MRVLLLQVLTYAGTEAQIISIFRHDSKSCPDTNRLSIVCPAVWILENAIISATVSQRSSTARTQKPRNEALSKSYPDERANHLTASPFTRVLPLTFNY